MRYFEKYSAIKKAFDALNSGIDEVITDGVKIFRRRFKSKSYEMLPGNDTYKCREHNEEFSGKDAFCENVGTINEDVHIKDCLVGENREFDYYIFRKDTSDTLISEAVFLFHGFNEKSWDKYLTWADYICRSTGKAVILFPIAFHMKRAPANWSAKRAMFHLSEKRKEYYPDIVDSSLSNVAISMRLHSMPQRFIWSGLQTYYDVLDFIEICKEGQNPLIVPTFKYDILAYSIGGFLALILKLANYRNYFDKSKVSLLCSGAVFNRLSPVSKMILDSQASVALYSYLVEHFDHFLKKDKHLGHYMDGIHKEGKVFHSMLDYLKLRVFREDLLRSNAEDIYAVALGKDKVIPAVEIINTLKGAYRDIPVRVDEMDADYDYTHENPFPVKGTDSDIVNHFHNSVMANICDFLSDK